MDVVEFAAARDRVHQANVRQFRSRVEAAGGDTDALRTVAKDMFADLWPDAPTQRGTAFARMAASALDATTDDSDPEVVTGWIETAAYNYGALGGAPAGAVKRWVTSKDERVRDVHARLHDTTRVLRGRWRVMPGADLLFPGQPRGPLAAWVNCRCVAKIEGGGTVTASMDDDLTAEFGSHDLLFLENRRTPKVVSRGARYTPKPSEGRIVRRRKANADEEKAIARGDWVRVNERGEKPGQPGYMEKKSRVRPQHNSGEVYAMDALLDDAPEVDEVPTDDMWDDEAARHEPLECHGVLAPEGIPSGDGRMFSAEALSWRDLPIPLMYQPSNMPGHDGSVVVGQISTIFRDGNLVRWSGRFADTDVADALVGLIGEGHIRGISVDVDSAELAVEDPEQENPLVEFAKGRISAATICAIPAFAEAYVALGPGPVDAQNQGEPSFAAEVEAGERQGIGGYPIENCADLRNAIQAIGRARPEDRERTIAHIRSEKKRLGCPEVELPDTWAAEDTDEFKRGPGWVTDPVPTARIHHYWTKGEGAAKIRWGTPGDFTRCTRQLRKYVGPQYLNRTCAQWHHDALGYWPGQKGMPGNPPFTADTEDCTDCETTALVASVGYLDVAATYTCGCWDEREWGNMAVWPAPPARPSTASTAPARSTVAAAAHDGSAVPATTSASGTASPSPTSSAPTAAPSSLLGEVSASSPAAMGASAPGTGNSPTPTRARTGPSGVMLNVPRRSGGSPHREADGSRTPANSASALGSTGSPGSGSSNGSPSRTTPARSAGAPSPSPQAAARSTTPTSTTTTTPDSLAASSAHPATGRSAGSAMIQHYCAQHSPTSMDTLTAAGEWAPPPRWMFDDPGLTRNTPITVEEHDGRLYVYGHLAVWADENGNSVCHIGIQDACVTPPQSKAAYGYFRTGVVLTDSGEVPVGNLTMDTGHAPLSMRARPAAAHYDDTGTVVADVAAGEDAYGIWVAGALRPGLSAEQVARFQGSALSGDWRAIGGNLELVGALAVNVPGFPVPRPALAASAADGQTALVAAGVLDPDPLRARLTKMLREQNRMRAEAVLADMEA